MRTGVKKQSGRTFTTRQSDGSRAGGDSRGAGSGSTGTVVSMSVRASQAGSSGGGASQAGRGTVGTGEAGRGTVGTGEAGRGTVSTRQARRGAPLARQARTGGLSVVSIPSVQIVRNLGCSSADRGSADAGSDTGSLVSVVFSRLGGVYHTHQHSAKRRRGRREDSRPSNPLSLTKSRSPCSLPNPWDPLSELPVKSPLWSLTS